MTKLPRNNPWTGSGCDDMPVIEAIEPGYAFEVLRVEGTVVWKEHGPGDPGADVTALKLRRFKSNIEPNLGKITLAVFKDSERSEDKYSELRFNITPDLENPFWGQGTECKIVCMIT